MTSSSFVHVQLEKILNGRVEIPRFEGEHVKILCSDPQKGTTLREYASVGVSHVEIGSTA